MGDHVELNFEVVRMQKWNIAADRSHRLDEKMG